jgi:hypothetical protein
MKIFLQITFLILCTTTFGQSKLGVDRRHAVKKIDSYKVKPISSFKKGQITYGDFIVASYEIITKKKIAKKELENLIGTMIRIKETDITGDQIDPMTIDNFGIEKMQKEDFILRSFGPKASLDCDKLSDYVEVYKTGRPDCYGLIILEDNKLALPYKGVLLFLDIK